MPAGLSSSRTWSRGEEKAFENAIATHWVDDSKEQWKRIASVVPNKTMEQVRIHSKLLLEDVNDIDAGIVPLPDYDGEKPSSPLIKDHSNK
ncbi:hypothetical protein LIER_19181 [Lithospermum erythrorhizon]|uniref:Myb-like domain-containing protein n=1 Tax=Lithospermum erythrorhizon TaxID=34254 RepID=A0AAV3QGU6_LITER